MKKLLSIGIPTFNRAEQLDNQLAWLAEEIKGNEDECEIIISDNCSTDSTQAVIDKWRLVFNQESFKFNRNSENIGLSRNIACCLNAAKNKYIWTIGDDDPIQSGTLSYVIETLKNKPMLTLMYLNFSDRHKNTGQVDKKHWFDTNLEEISDGKAVFQHCIEKSFGSTIFITATVYRTELAQLALKKWPSSVNNWGGQAYWTGFCASQGDVLVTKKNYLECIIGVSYWQKESNVWSNIYHRDIPEVYLKLWSLGYSHKFCSQMILKNFKENIHFKDKLEVADIVVYLRALKNWPRRSISVLIFLLFSVFKSFVELIIFPKERVSHNLANNT